MKLISENVPGNLHAAAAWCNRCGIEDVITMEFGGGHITVVVYRVSDEAYANHMQARGINT